MDPKRMVSFTDGQDQWLKIWGIEKLILIRN